MFEVDGVHKSGRGIASRCESKQLPLIAEEFPEVSGCHCGTINLQLDRPLLVLSPDRRTKPLKWDRHSPHDVFDLLRVELLAPIAEPAGRSDPH